MNIKRTTLLPALALVVSLGLQVCVSTALGQAPGQAPGAAPAAQAAPQGGQRMGMSSASTPIQSDTVRSITNSFTLATKTPIAPDAKGFIRRWLVLEPIDKPNRGNTVFIDSYLRTNFAKEYFPNQMTIMPKHGDVTTATTDAGAKQQLKWYALDSKMFNFKLFRFSYAISKPQYSVLFWMVTVINAPEEIKNVRMSVGSNSASMWWLNGKEALLMSGDRRMVADDATSKRLTLNKGKNIVRGAVINGPGMSDFCVRFVDEKGQPVKNITITCE